MSAHITDRQNCAPFGSFGSLASTPRTLSCSAVLASLILKERLAFLGKLGCGLCIVGSTIIVLNAPEEMPITSVEQITIMMATNLGKCCGGGQTGGPSRAGGGPGTNRQLMETRASCWGSCGS